MFSAPGRVGVIFSAPGRLGIMTEETKEQLVGAGVVVAFALFVGFVSSLQDIHTQSEAGYRVSAAFGKIDGLPGGAEVRLGGIEVGSVVGEKLSEHYRAVLTLQIADHVRLPTDTSAAVQTDGLFGTKYINLEPGGAEEFIPSGGAIRVTQDSLVVADLLEQIIAQGEKVAKKRDEKK